MALGEQLAVVCPGHGGEHEAMRARVVERRPDLLALAERLVGCDPFERVGDGTAYIQPAVYCASLAGWEAVREDVEPVAVAGHSLGEFAAAVIAGAMSAEAGLQATVLRGRACQSAADAQPGGMLALKVEAKRASVLAANYGLCVVNENAPNQMVVAGGEERISALQRDARELGVSAIRLRTAVPFHTDAMRQAAESLGEALSSADISSPRYTVLSAATAKPFEDIRAELAQALVRPVRWQATTLALKDMGTSQFVETGPGRVLSRLISQTVDIPVRSLEDAF